jgi:hypothetical protein
MADTRNIGGHLNSGGQPHTGNFAQRRVWFFRCRGIHTGANTPFLRRPFQGRGVGLFLDPLAAFLTNWLIVGISSSYRLIFESRKLRFAQKLGFVYRFVKLFTIFSNSQAQPPKLYFSAFATGGLKCSTSTVC